MKFNQCKEGTKNRLEAALSGVEMIFNEVLRPSDLVTLIAFDDAIHTVVPLKKKSELNLNEIHKKILNIEGGRTAMYDGICKALGTMSKNDNDPELQREFIILTDGEDTCSSPSSRSKSSQKLMEPGVPHFHALFIGVGMSNSASQSIRNLCSKKPHHLRYCPVEDSCKAIRRAYKESKAYQLRITKYVEKTIYVCSICEKPGHNSAQCRNRV